MKKLIMLAGASMVLSGALVGISAQKAAAYAGGLSVESLERQWAEIDALNAELAPFRLLKGVEVTAGSDDAFTEPLFNSELRVHVFAKVCKRRGRKGNAIRLDGVTYLLGATL